MPRGCSTSLQCCRSAEVQEVGGIGSNCAGRETAFSAARGRVTISRIIILFYSCIINVKIQYYVLTSGSELKL